MGAPKIWWFPLKCCAFRGPTRRPSRQASRCALPWARREIGGVPVGIKCGKHKAWSTQPVKIVILRGSVSVLDNFALNELINMSKLCLFVYRIAPIWDDFK